MKKLVIGITDGRLFENYANWIAASGNIELVRLGYKFKNLAEVEKCQGLFMTGGEDVHPTHYNKPSYVEEFKLRDFDERRDEFEMKLLSHWQTSKIPLLGVCRGMQLVNVFLGGTLIPDLPSFGKFNHARMATEPRYHPVQIDPNSQLFSILQLTDGDITSMHHQSIDRIAEGMVTNAITTDGVIEGAEWLDPNEKPPSILVQWHPEVMQQVSPFAANIREYFTNLLDKQ